jgi:exonuclease III
LRMIPVVAMKSLGSMMLRMAASRKRQHNRFPDQGLHTNAPTRAQRSRQSSQRSGTPHWKKRHQLGRKTKANTKIGTINMNGKRSKAQPGSPQFGKWSDIKDAIRNENIAILAVQETHLSQEQAKTVQKLYAPHMKIIHSPGLVNPTASTGVAFVLNKRLLNTDDSKFKAQVLIPGRALLLEIRWHNDEHITLLNVYAPAERDEQPAFWEKLTNRWKPKDNENGDTTELPRPDVILGDFNIVEDVVDRYPPSEDEIASAAAEALLDFRLTIGVADTWRELNPEERVYTFARGASTRSRLERIYVAFAKEQLMSDWCHNNTSVASNHSLVTVK